MKRNKTLRIAIVLLALVMVSTIGMASTLARYVDTINGTAVVVRAGIWDVDLDEDFEFEAAMSITAAADRVGGAATGVAARNDDIIIVPGTTISFGAPEAGLIVENNSEVPADIVFAGATVTVVGFTGVLDTALQFRIDDGAWGTLAQANTALETLAANAADSIIDTVAADSTATVSAADFPVIQARWAFEIDGAQNTADTAVGSGQPLALSTNTISVVYNLRAQQAAAA